MKGGFFIKFYCPVCGNSNSRYFFKLKDRLCCRKCIEFIGKKAKTKYMVKKGQYALKYSLTSEQIKASDFILEKIKQNKTCALNAVCGAGKTEIIYESIKYCLNNNKKVGIAIPRKDVVVELENRLKKDFNVTVVGVYGGNSEIIEGDIIVFTTHQAFRYISYFDVLFVDEVDAFPYKGNVVLQQIINNCSNVLVYMSATMPLQIEKDNCIEKYYLNKRYHGNPLPVPKCVPSINMIYALKRYLNRYKDKIVIIYFPTIKIEHKISKKIKYDYLINSKTENRKYMLENIKKLDRGIVLSTTVLERGITIKDVQVIVYNSDHNLFDSDVLIQIAGRVGRHKDYCKGNVIFICKRKNKNIKRAISKIKGYNA